MNKLKILVKRAKAQKTGKEYFKYSTQNNDGKYIDVKFNSNNVDLKKLPEKTFIIYVEPAEMNLKVKLKDDNTPVVSQRTGEAVKILWISKIDHFADEAEVEAEIAKYRAEHAEKIAQEFPQA